ncbi:RNA ligase [Gordonia phage Bantam]|uniref:RNA ligase n=1 Tax=Gordonia phage Bantam TaxID=1887641 RepID=A0A1B3AYG2_9CAUD|nr:RNA ligase [Gordonia phage Bantam]AOE43790.1 RNA ligase [Gordonia phage Bantam]
MTLTFERPLNPNYAATVIELGSPTTLANLDNLVGFPVYGLQALTTKDHFAGELMVAFTAETQLSEEFARENNLFRKTELNADPEADRGYLEENRRVRAIRLRGEKSSALLLPVSCLTYAGVDPSDLESGMTFDQVNGHEICRKYVVPVKGGNANRAAKQAEKVFRQVDERVFPRHVETANFWRSLNELKHYASELIITQKLHGTSVRAGNVPVLNPPIEPRFNGLRRSLGLKPKPAVPATTVWAEDTRFTVGSKRVIKDENATQGFYGDVDVFTVVAEELLAGKIPENYMVYGEIIGWVPGTDKPIQKGYTYGLPEGRADLYIYRVATINRTGQIADLPWDAVKTFCRERGLKWTPELFRIPARILQEREDREILVFNIEDILDHRFEDAYLRDGLDWADKPVPLSDPKSVDEGVCIRQDYGVVPTILKAKSPLFFEYETKQADKGEIDIETLESEAAA